MSEYTPHIENQRQEEEDPPLSNDETDSNSEEQRQLERNADVYDEEVLIESDSTESEVELIDDHFGHPIAHGQGLDNENIPIELAQFQNIFAEASGNESTSIQVQMMETEISMLFNETISRIQEINSSLLNYFDDHL